MLLGSLPNKVSAWETRANPLQHYCLQELAQAETSVPYLSGDLFLYQRKVLPISATRSEASNKNWLVNCPSAKDAPNSIGGGGNQTGSEESDGGTARKIGDQLQWNLQ